MCTEAELWPDLTPVEETYTERIRRIWHKLDDDLRTNAPASAEERDRWIQESQPYPSYLKHGKHCRITSNGYGDDNKRNRR